MNGSHPVLPYIPASSVFCTAYPECTTSLDQAVCGREMDDMTEKDGRNIVPFLLMRKDVCACLALQYRVFLMHAFAQLKILQLDMSMYTYACYLPSFFLALVVI